MSFLVSRTVTLRVPFNEAAERVCEGVGETYGPAERERKKRFLVLSQGKRGLLFKAISFPPKEALFSVCLFPCAFNANPISVLWTKFRSCPGKKKKTFFSLACTLPVEIAACKTRFMPQRARLTRNDDDRGPDSDRECTFGFILRRKQLCGKFRACRITVIVSREDRHRRTGEIGSSTEGKRKIRRPRC